MEQVREELLQVLRAAVAKRRRDDTLEQAVGREARRAGLSYQDYLQVVEAVRERSRKDKADAWDTAKAMSKDDQQ